MTQNSIKPLLLGLVFLAGLFYLYAIIQAGYTSINQGSQIDNFLISAVTIIGGILATNLGAVLGITFAMPQNRAIHAGVPKTFLGLRPTVSSSGTLAGATPGANSDGSIDNNQKLQIIACYFYVGSMVLALAFWMIARSKGNETPVSILPELSKTLLGVIAGSLTVSLTK